MTKDYAKRRVAGKKATTKPRRGSYLMLWLLTLALFGAFTFGLVYIGKHQRQFRHNTKKASKHQVIVNAAANETVKASITPKFDFYTLLPQKNKNAVVPEYELDVATVKDYLEADHLKAEIALLGIEVNINSFKKDTQQLYRISTGPYDNKDAAIADQARLKQSNIKSSLKKLK